MVQQSRQKSKRSNTRGARSAKEEGKPGELVQSVQRLEAEIEALREQRDSLNSELEGAKARIAELEDVQSQVINRIDWVIDSLHNVSKGES